MIVHIISYADDTVILVDSKTWQETETKMNLRLKEINRWLAYNKLSLNISKTSPL